MALRKFEFQVRFKAEFTVKIIYNYRKGSYIMVRKISASQLRSKVQRTQSKVKQAVTKQKREMRKYNQKVKQAANKYNNEVRKHNRRVRANQQRITSELNRLQSRKVSVRYQTVKTSAISLNMRYESLNAREDEFKNIDFGNVFLDLSEKENANSLEVSNVLESDLGQEQRTTDLSSLRRTEISSMLESISPDLNNRWEGALFSLNSQNPDAARHFCTSAREVFVQILDKYAPDEAVLRVFPDCETTDKCVPTRKEKIRYLLKRTGITENAAVNFVDENVKNILELFRVFNDGTHGSSGKFSINQLMTIKTRVEDGITYLFSIRDYQM